MITLRIDREEAGHEVQFRLQVRPSGYVVGEVLRRRLDQETGDGRTVSFLVPPHDLDFLLDALAAQWHEGEPDRAAGKGDYLLQEVDSGRWMAAPDDAALAELPALSALVARLRDGAERAAALSRPA